jgi:N-acetylneuraminate synthase
MIDFNNLKTPYLIGEIGINHNGDMQIAKRLIDAVFACQWDCVKFQKRNPDVAVPEKQKKIMRDTPWGKMSYIKYKHRIEFGKEEYDYINNYCNEKPLDWTMSVWDHDSLAFACDYDLPFLKLPSAMLTRSELLIATAKTNKPIIISTGMSTLEEIDVAVNILEKHAKTYALLHCNSSYPAKEYELNLRVIPMLKERYGCAVGYSGHEYGLRPTYLATVMGAQIIERHITYDREMWGTDQSSSVEISGMFMLRNRLLNIEKLLGDGKKVVTESEEKIRRKLRGDD